MRRTLESSEYNRLPQVIQGLDFSPDVFIVDSTIRSLQHAPSGSRHTAKDLIEIGKALHELGVRELILNHSWKDGLEVCEGLAQENLHCKIVTVCRAQDPNWKRCAEDGIGAGADEICCESMPDATQMRRMADFVHGRGKKVSHAFSKQCRYRNCYQEVVDLCRAGVQYGYESQSFNDSYFLYAITPEAIKFLVRSLRTDVPQCPPLYIHLSDFYGHATMTAVAALTAGASAVDVCMNPGIGHHCGHTPLEQVVMVLEGLYGINTGIKLEKLREVSLLVRERTGIPVPLTSPMVGDFAFTTDGGLRDWQAEADPSNLSEEKLHRKFPFSPSIVGAEERVIWSDKRTTPAGVRAKLASMGLAYQESDVERIIERLAKVLQGRQGYPNWILDAEFEELCRTTIGTREGRR